MAFMEVQKVYSGGYQPSTIGRDISDFGKTLLDLSAQDKQRAMINADKMMENAKYQAEKERQAKLDAANAEVQAQNMLNMKQEYSAKKDSLAIDKLTNEQLGKLISADLQAANGIVSTNKVYEDLASKASGMSSKEYTAALDALNTNVKDKSFKGSRGMVTDEFLKGTNVGEILKYTDKLKAEDAAIDKDKTSYLRDELKDDKNFAQQKEIVNLQFANNKAMAEITHRYNMSEKDPKEPKDLTSDQRALLSVAEDEFNKLTPKQKEVYGTSNIYLSTIRENNPKKYQEMEARVKVEAKKAEDALGRNFDSFVKGGKIRNPEDLIKVFKEQRKIYSKDTISDAQLEEAIMKNVYTTEEDSVGWGLIGTHKPKGTEAHFDNVNSGVKDYVSSLKGIDTSGSVTEKTVSKKDDSSIGISANVKRLRELAKKRAYEAKIKANLKKLMEQK